VHDLSSKTSHVLQGHTKDVNSVAFCGCLVEKEDGAVLSASHDGTVRLWKYDQDHHQLGRTHDDQVDLIVCEDGYALR
jgi:WD40 repeat protein